MDCQKMKMAHESCRLLFGARRTCLVYGNVLTLVAGPESMGIPTGVTCVPAQGTRLVFIRLMGTGLLKKYYVYLLFFFKLY
jgi:hypothetical protein